MPAKAKSTKKKHSPFYKQLLQIFKSKRLRNVVIAIFLIFATLSMFCIDTENYFRDEYLPFLNDNFIANLFIWIGIGRYDVTASAWVLFGCIMSIVLMIFIGNIIAPKFVDNMTKKNTDLFSSENKVRTFYSVIYYAVIVLIAGVFILAFYFLGAFDLFSANTVERSPFVSLIVMLGIFLAILLLIPITIIIVLPFLKQYSL